MSSAFKERSGRTPSQRTGLTIADYRANPVMRFSAARRKNNPPATATSPVETKESKLKTFFPKTPGRSTAPLKDYTVNRLPEGSAKERIERSISEAAKNYGLSPRLINAVIKAEIGFQCIGGITARSKRSYAVDAGNRRGPWRG